MLQRKMFQEMADKKIFVQAGDLAFRYAETAFDRTVFPSEEALRDLSVFEEEMPERTADPSDVLDMLHRFGSPATVSQIGGRYFGFVNGGVIPTGLAARWLSDFWDQNAALYVTSPLVSKIESVLESWLNRLLGLPEDTAAGFVSGSSMATFCGLAAARFRILSQSGWNINEQGLRNAPPIRIVTGRHAHATVLKAVALLGFGTNTIEYVDVDSQGRVIPENFPELDDRTIVILQAGNVNSGSFDNFQELCGRAERAGSWVHIDGAFGLWAAGTKRLKHLTKGFESAQSWSVDGHKTLNAPYDNGVILCRDKDALTSALQAAGSYIPYDENRNGMLYTPEMSRRSRAVEFWATLKYLGKEGVDQLIWGFHERALQFADELQNAFGFEVLNDVVFNQVMVCCENDEITQRTMEKIQESRECWSGPSVWFGKRVIRISVCSWATTEEDVSRSVQSFIRAHETALEETSDPLPPAR